MSIITKALAPCLLAASFVVTNADTDKSLSGTGTNIALEATERVRSMLLQREHAHKKSMEKLMSDMTLPHAMEMLQQKQGSNAHSVTVIQDALEGGRKSHRSKKQSLRAISVPAPSVPAAIKGAIDEINKMIEENQQKYDLELHKCCEYDEIQSGLIEGCRQDISLLNARATAADTCIFEQETTIDMCEKKLPELDDSLKTHNRECSMEIAELRAQLKIITGDLSVMSMILGTLEKCKTDLNGVTFMVQRCMDGCGSFVSTNHKEVQNHLDMLQSDTARDLVHDNFDDSEMEADDAANMTNISTTWSPPEVPDMTVLRRRPCKEPYAADKRSSKCTIGKKNCLKLAERFLYIEAGLKDKKEELEENLLNTETECEHVEHVLNAQISQYGTLQKACQAKLAECRAEKAESEEQARLKTIELNDMTADYAAVTKQCHANYKELESEDCGLKKIRGEVVKLESADNPAFFTDCVVGEWIVGECSVSCGGGMRMLTREITTEPSAGGSGCPVLYGQEQCNQQKCPIDCILNDWSGWSGCTAECGGGVQQRSTTMRVEPEHGGEPCGEDSQVQSCNIQDCDKDCILQDWSQWTDCSKECDGGTRMKTKLIEEQAVGNGHCDDDDSWYRKQYEPCNMFPCIKESVAETLICQDTLDVVLLIDGSGSIGPTGWEKSKHAAKLLMDAFKGDSKSDNEVAVLLYSKYTTTVSHFTKDFEAAKTAIDGMSWPRSYTKTGRALDTAGDELALGRPESKTVVICITDGRPMSTRYTKRAAENLRKKARLLWVPVTRWAPLNDIKKWASEPTSENIVEAQSWDVLESPELLDEVVSDLCEHVS